MPSPREICFIAGVAQFLLSLVVLLMCFIAPDLVIEYWPEIKLFFINLVRCYNAISGFRNRRHNN